MSIKQCEPLLKKKRYYINAKHCFIILKWNIIAMYFIKVLGDLNKLRF